MSAPVKPWERPGANYRNHSSLPVNSMSASPLEDRIQSSLGTSTAASAVSTPPQVPPRVSQLNTGNNRFGIGMGYGGFGNYSSYGGYGGYSSPLGYGGMYSSPYSSYGGGYGYNRTGDVRSTFALHAEESSRPAFESIESIVFAVNSVGMMLDSTFQAVYNSFRAVIGVADNFTRLKSQLVQVFSALAFIRTLKYLFRKLLELLRIRPRGEAEKLWREAFEEAAFTAAASPDGYTKKSTWPILMFFGIIMGGPYLIWRLISAFSGSTVVNGWATGDDDHFMARANFSFQGQSTEELSFSAGQNIKVAPKEIQPRVRGWLLASVDGQKTGMIPANYVTILGKRRGTKNGGSAYPPALVQSDSSLSLAHEAQFPLSASRQMRTVPEDDLESVFSANSTSSMQSTQRASHIPPDSSIQEAADILNDADI
ncbi:hypothetical protein BsWGS_19874 [Bradybaena similaris]